MPAADSTPGPGGKLSLWVKFGYGGNEWSNFTCYTLLNVPYGALAAEMTQDYDERTSLNVWRTGAAQIAALMGGALPLVLAGVFEDVGGSAAFGWSAAAAVLGFISIFGILLTWRVTRGYGVLLHVGDVGEERPANHRDGHAAASTASGRRHASPTSETPASRAARARPASSVASGAFLRRASSR